MMASAEEKYKVLADKIAEENRKSAERMAKKADYKIQIWFRSDRSMHKPIAYTLSFWESGKRLHGGGDEMMYVCRRHADAPKIAPFEIANVSRIKNITEKGCDKLIPGGLLDTSGLVVCPHCGIRHRSDQVGDSIFYRTSIDQAARILVTWWRKMECNADIYAKYSPQDPRTVMMLQNYNPRVAREKKGLTIYPLENILKDTMSGATVESRFKAFITA